MIVRPAKKQIGLLVKGRVGNGPRCAGKKCEENSLKSEQGRGLERKAKLRGK